VEVDVVVVVVVGFAVVVEVEEVVVVVVGFAVVVEVDVVVVVVEVVVVDDEVLVEDEVVTEGLKTNVDTEYGRSEKVKAVEVKCSEGFWTGGL
jgi:hypothetical protein